MQTGAVTFLDVLGWKGIWLRRSPEDVVRDLNHLIEAAQQESARLRGESVR